MRNPKQPEQPAGPIANRTAVSSVIILGDSEPT